MTRQLLALYGKEASRWLGAKRIECGESEGHSNRALAIASRCFVGVSSDSTTTTLLLFTVVSSFL